MSDALSSVSDMHQIFTTGSTRPDGRILDSIEGAAYGAGVSLIFEDSDQDGDGPDLHQHPYPETFVIRGGKALFTVAGEQLLGLAGQVLVVPKLTPHKFEVVGPGALHRNPHPRERHVHHRVARGSPGRK